jgi:DNA-directed RNA polymerase subunit beta'
VSEPTPTLDDLLGLSSKPLPGFRLRLARQEAIRAHSEGPITDAKYINKGGSHPKDGGLGCEKIFGPETDARQRRERAAHIELASPIVHPWFHLGKNSPLALLLGFHGDDLQEVLQGRKAVALPHGRGQNEQDSLRTGSEALAELLSSLDLSARYRALRQHWLSLRASQETSAQQRRRVERELAVVLDFLNSGVSPPVLAERLVMHLLPVLPAGLRPVVRLRPKQRDAELRMPDLNILYRRVILHNQRLLGYQEKQAPGVQIRHAERLLQLAVDALFDNSHCKPPVRNWNKVTLQSLTDRLSGKHGRLRRNLLGKSVDYSGRAVIAVDPRLRLCECGLPLALARELYRPFLLRRLQQSHRLRRREAVALLGSRDPIHQEQVWEALEEVIADHPVLLNRAPTLHRMNVQAFQPVLVPDRAIRIHPLVCAGFAADFDGDKMGAHLVLSGQARVEANTRVAADRNLFSPATGEANLALSQDIVLGCAYLTWAGKPRNQTPPVRYDRTLAEIFQAYERGALPAHERVGVTLPREREVISDQSVQPRQLLPPNRLETTAGRVVFDALLTSLPVPPGSQPLPFYNAVLNKGLLGEIIAECHQRLGSYATLLLLERAKTLGFQQATRAGLSLRLDDLAPPRDQHRLLQQAARQVSGWQKSQRQGKLSASTCYEKTIHCWQEVLHQLEERLKEQLAQPAEGEGPNPVYLMAASRARGNWTQICQLAAPRGLIGRAYGPRPVVEVPITASLRQGLSQGEFFLSVHGAYRAGADKKRLPDSGYLTRRLVAALQSVRIVEEDCQTTERLLVHVSRPGEALPSVVGRVGREVASEGKNPVARQGESLLTRADVQAVWSAGVREWSVRSPLFCQAKGGLCQACYGANPATHALVQLGEPVGVIAAQSLGEPSTQLAMQTKHTGRLAGGENVSTGLDRVIALLESPQRIQPQGETRAEALVRALRDIYVKIGKRLQLKHFELVVARLGNWTIIRDPADTLLPPGRPVPTARFEALNQNLQHNWRKIVAVGDSPWQVGQVVRRETFESQVREAQHSGKVSPEATDPAPALGEPTFLGLKQVVAHAEGFLAAAGFEKTRDVLRRATLTGKIEPVAGLHENLLLGRLIPAGSNFHPPAEPVHVDPRPVEVEVSGGTWEPPHLVPLSQVPARYQKLSNEELLQEYYASNDPVAFEAFSLRMQPELEWWITVQLDPREDRPIQVAEILQGIMERIADSRAPGKRFDPARGSLKTWLSRCLSSARVDFFRRHGTHVDFSGLERQLQGENLLDSEETTPETVVLSEEERTLFQECLSTLEVRERLYITDVTMHDVPNQEFARQQGISAPTASRLGKRALENLRQCLQRRGFRPGGPP